MATKASRRLVIDVSIAQSAGEAYTDDPRSENCHNFLEAVLAICHHVAMTPPILDEWHRHRSRYSHKWLTRMYGRKKVVALDTPSDARLRRKIERVAASGGDREAMLKDCHLIEAALATDRVVVSLDQIARDLFDGTADRVSELRCVAWVNPDDLEEDAIRWLETGAQPEKHRQLGHKRQEKK